MTTKGPIYNTVKTRFLPFPETAAKCLEPEAKITDFEIKKELGAGSFGHVFLVTHKVTGAKYAIKAIDKRNKTNQEEKPYFRREIEIMYKIHHPNVVKLFGHFEDNNYCYFIMEYIAKGNIYSLIPKDNKKRLSTKIVASLMRDVISAVYFLHHMNPMIIHRDIKPENVLLADDISAKLTDFGWSNYMSGDKRTTVCGTPIYLAPEIINEAGHDEKVDNWCIGVLLFELCTGTVPFQGNDLETLKNNIKHMRIMWTRDISTDAKNLISKILKYEPSQRMSLEDMLKHPFFTKYFPDAQNCLIKPSDNSKYRPFIISKDDPLTWNPQSDGSGINIININSNNTNKIIPTTAKSRSKSGDKISKNRGASPSPNSNINAPCPINKYNELKKKYDVLSKELESLKSSKTTVASDSSEVEALRKEICIQKEKINTLNKMISQRNENESEYTSIISEYEYLKKENEKLKAKNLEYEEYIKKCQESSLSSQFKDLRDSISEGGAQKFEKAYEDLLASLEKNTRNDLMKLISEKDKEIEEFKKNEKAEREKEKKKYTALINKYDKTLNWIERENKELKMKLQELQKK